jgi:hypothetical protein
MVARGYAGTRVRRQTFIHRVSLLGHRELALATAARSTGSYERAGCSTCYSDFPNREDLERQIISATCGWFDGCIECGVF